MKRLSKTQETQISNEVNTTVALLFIRCHQQAETKSGDISPMQELELDQVVEKLTEILISQINQNL